MYPPLPQSVPQLPGKTKDDDGEGKSDAPNPNPNPDSPVLHNPVLLPPAAHAVAHQQHGVVDVFWVTVAVVVNT